MQGIVIPCSTTLQQLLEREDTVMRLKLLFVSCDDPALKKITGILVIINKIVLNFTT